VLMVAASRSTFQKSCAAFLLSESASAKVRVRVNPGVPLTPALSPEDGGEGDWLLCSGEGLRGLSLDLLASQPEMAAAQCSHPSASEGRRWRIGLHNNQSPSPPSAGESNCVKRFFMQGLLAP